MVQNVYEIRHNSAGTHADQHVSMQGVRGFDRIDYKRLADLM